MKKLLSAMLVLVMLASMIVMPTYAVDETVSQTTPGYCQHCKTVIPEEQWLPWDPTNLGPRTGHYYLDRDINDQAKQITINLDDDLMRNVICLDLRGRSYNTEKFRPFLIYGIFSIMDSVGGGEITTTGQTTNANGGFCQMGKKTGCVDGSGELNLYSGTIRKVNTDTEIVAYGGLIYVSADATFNMYGGKLVGGDVYARLNSKGSPVSPLGGTIFATGANVNIYGGTVTGGVANDTTLTLSDGTTKNYEGNGGNIYAEKSSVVTIAGGVVENGYSDTYGGNMTIKSSDLIITGGEIRGGYSEGASGNINMSSTDCTFKMSGGVLKNGVCTTRGGNLFVNNAGIDVEITGGEIYGDLSIGLFKSLKLSGSPKIYMGLSNGLRLQSTNETKMDISGLTEGAEIYLDGVDQTFTGVLENAETYASYFKDAIRADITVTENGELAVAQGSTGFCPHCWESGEQATWTEWHNKNNTSTSLLAETGSAHYYLTGTVTRKGIIGIGTSSVKDNDIVFDAAGQTWTTTDKKLFNLYGTLSLMDSVGGGKFTSTGHTEANGGVIMGSGSCTFNMYSGVLSRTVKSGEEMKNVLVGGILYAPSSSSTNVYGGTIRDGISASVSAKKNICKGGNICAEGSFTMTAGALIGGKAYTNSYILQDTANPILNSSGNATTYTGTGGNLYVSGEATITGGHLVDGNAGYGGNLYASSTAKLTLSGAVLRGGVADETAGTTNPDHNLYMYGGNLYITGSSSKQQVLAIEDTVLRSGNAREFGGNIYATMTDLTLRNSIITDGVAGLQSGDDGRGGNLYLTGTVIGDMYDTTVGNGYALGHGGNLYAPDGIAFYMYSGLFTSGEAKSYGGNMYCNGMYLHGGIITNGTSGLNGGNIFVYEGASNFLTIEATADAPAPIVSNGKASSLGGNIYISKNTTGTITGAIIENGTGDTGSKNSSFNADNVYANVGTTLTITDSVIRGIEADGTSGNGVYAGNKLILCGDTTITNEEKASCIYIASTGKLTVDETFSGETSVAFEDSHFADPEEPQGGTLADQNTATGVFTGKLLLEGYLGRNYGMPAVFAEANDQKLYVASTAVINGDETSWYRDATAAAAAIPQGAYLRLFATNNTIEMTGDLTVDLNGKNLTVTGTGKLSGFDSANDEYEAYGVATVGAGVEVEPAYQATKGRHYIAVTNEQGTSFHRLGMHVSTVSVRPSLAGIYYNGIWECDDILKAKIKTFGVAVSTNDMPTAESLSELDTICTAYKADKFEAGKEKTSVLIKNILKADADNAKRGTTEIHTALYTVIDDSSGKDLVIMGDDNGFADGGVTYTLQSVLQKVDLIWPKLTESQQASVKQMYNIDAKELATWELYNITAAINGTASVRPLKILTLGHSLAVDSCHMLNLVAAAEGYNQPLEIATLYYSGCPLYKHVNYLTNNSAVYDLYVSSVSTPEKPPVIQKGVTMKYGIQYADWDIIIMQGGVFEIAYDKTYTEIARDGKNRIQIIQDYVNQHKINPDAIFAWHMPWATPTDTTLRDMYPYSPNSYYTSYEAFNDDRSQFYNAITGCVGKNIVTDPTFIYLIPSGTAIENALSSHLVESDLHRDYAHVTDYGRVIAAYTWYCTLTGVDHLDEIKLDSIPKAFLKSTEDKTQDRVLTDMEKAIILEAVNNALKNPLQMTQSQYTEAPTES